MKEGLSDQLKRMKEKSLQSLEIARDLFSKGYHGDSSSKAYYAVFHALQAVLLTKGLTHSKHQQVIGSFNKECIHTGLFPKDFSKWIERLFKDRQISDYEYLTTISRDSAKEDLKRAETIILAIAEYLKKEGLLNT